ncbi:uncharacterized protein LOC101849234 isoform X1 [Aplysia californica]|uniref:Uncharacterized protein LOC101849234 isoform X1 n=1 Tax=Aplysia californica TaxID=6500 RepID=A0ABM1A890_APLCA|nr:uncharacterized protein LOC101849234 isoform X1 [Aplysia californica]
MDSSERITSDRQEDVAEVGSNDYSRYGIRDVPVYTTTTALGKTKTFAGLFAKEWIFLFVSSVNILSAIGLTLYRMITVLREDPESADFTFTLLLLINAGFCIYYVVHGVLRERVYELYALMAAILVVVMYCILEYFVINPDGHTTVKLVRVVMVCAMAPPNIILAFIVSRNFGFLEFRIVGASEYLQKLYRQAAIFSCLLKFDLQASCSIVILALKDGTNVSLVETISLAIGLPYSLFWCFLGWISLRQELKKGAIVFAVLGLIKPMYYLYKIINEYINLRDDSVPTEDTIVYSLIAAVTLGLLVWLMGMVELVYVYKNFGKGLKERVRGSNFESQLIANENTGLLSGSRSSWSPR